MNRLIRILRYSTGTLLLGGALTLGAVAVNSVTADGGFSQAFADEDDDYEQDEQQKFRDYEYLQNNSNSSAEIHDDRVSRQASQTISSPGTTMADAATYRDECGSCHLPYPAKFLPARSWQKMLSGLDNHFGEDASISEARQAELLAYLSANSASNHTRYLKGLAYNDTPQRISELPYFRRKHREVPERMVSGNPQVGSFSQCDSCHKDAAQGKFNEHTVVIPGFGRWDD